MKYSHFDASETLVGLASMLESLGHHTEDYHIALGMNAPWLFLKENGQYITGQGLYTPQWLNLYLHPLGFHLDSKLLPKDEIPALLRTQESAMIFFMSQQGKLSPGIFCGYAHGRYTFHCVSKVHEPLLQPLSLSRPMLMRRLENTVQTLTLKRCPPQDTNFVPLLVQTLQTLQNYERALMDACAQTVSREEMSELHVPLFRALMVDMLPMAQLLGQPVLYEELRLLNHDYSHAFTRNSPQQIQLWERIPRSSIRKSIAWMKENTIDRLYQCGLSDEQVIEIHADLAHGN